MLATGSVGQAADTVSPESVTEATQETSTEPALDSGSSQEAHQEITPQDQTVSTSFDELQLFADTFDAIRQGYVEEVTDAELFEMAVKGMLTSLDPHSILNR